MSRALSSLDRVTFLVLTADGMGGVARTVNNLASSLADQHEVEIISLSRRRNKPRYAIDGRVQVTYLLDERKTENGERRRNAFGPPGREPMDSHDPSLDKQPSHFSGSAKGTPFSALTDALLREKLRSLPAGIFISPFWALHDPVIAWAPRSQVMIAQEHLNLSSRKAAGMTVAHRDVLRRFDCLVTLTNSDAVDYATLLEGAPTVVAAIPNAVPWDLGPLETRSTHVVATAGRLVAQKGFDRVIEAYAPTRDAFPDWQLHVYGTGDQRRRLRRLISSLGVESHVHLKGYSRELPAELSRAAVYAMGSHYEGFPMVLLEAMSLGLPPVSYDCPTGPAELIQDGVNGRLVANGDTAAFTDALAQLMADKAMRERLGRASRITAEGYTTPVVVDQWESLFRRLLQERR